MKYRLILVVVIAIILSAVKVFAQEKVVETEKQKAVATQFQNEVKQLQEATTKLIVPLKAQKYDIDEQIKDIEKEAQKKLQELQAKYAELYKNADKEIKK